jgi:hypothetical protein
MNLIQVHDLISSLDLEVQRRKANMIRRDYARRIISAHLDPQWVEVNEVVKPRR